MRSSFARQLSSVTSIAALTGMIALSAGANGEQIPAHHLEGTLHGYLAIRDASGQVLAAGDLVQVVRGNRVTAHLVFHFKDGSLDDETAVFTQHGTFQLISDHHIQKGPFFEHPMDMSVDAAKGEVAVRSEGKDGKNDVHTDHMKLPPDLCSPGMITTIVKNLPAGAAGTEVSMLVATPKPRLIKLAFSAQGEDKFSIAGSERQARHYAMKFNLQGIVGLVAPLVGRQPPDVEIWIEPGEVPAFVKEQGPLSEGGPIVTIQQAGPVGPKDPDATPAK